MQIRTIYRYLGKRIFVNPFNLSSSRPAAALVLMLSMTGCIGPNTKPAVATAPVQVEDRSTVGGNSTNSDIPSTGTPSPIEPNQAEQGKNRVTLALLEKSETARGQGNLKEAVTHVERAIRINPRRADLWVHLAQLQLALEAPTIAEGYARKAIALAGSRVDWKRDAWLVIADAKQAQGLVGEADAIRQRWRTAQG